MFEHLGTALRSLRERAGKSLTQVAREAAIGKSQLSLYERGKRLPKLEVLAKLLAALDLEPLALFYLEHVLGQTETPARAAPLDLLRSKRPLPFLGAGELRTFHLILDLLFQSFATMIEKHAQQHTNPEE
jgi:transcriptional regulator with XRE-family HTH domain